MILFHYWHRLVAKNISMLKKPSEFALKKLVTSIAPWQNASKPFVKTLSVNDIYI